MEARHLPTGIWDEISKQSREFVRLVTRATEARYRCMLDTALKKSDGQEERGRVVFCSALPDLPWLLERSSKQKGHHVPNQDSFQTPRINEQRKKTTRFRQKGPLFLFLHR